MVRLRPDLTLLYQIRERGLPAPVREHRFHPVRRWRFDFAWPDRMLAAEIEGGVFTRGRHVRGAGFTRDAEKYNNATLLGWQVIRVTPAQISGGDAIEWITQALTT